LALVVGSQFVLPGSGRIVVHAMDREGYASLCALITRARRRTPKGSYQLLPADLDDTLPGCRVLWLADRQPRVDAHGVTDDTAPLAGLVERFEGRLGIGVGRFREADDSCRAAQAEEWSRRFGLPVLAVGDVRMHTRARHPLLDVLMATRLGSTVAAAAGLLLPNAERSLRSPATLARLYPRAWLDAAVTWAECCTFTLDCLRYEYPEELVPPGRTPVEHLRVLTAEGAARRWPGGVPAMVSRQIEHELALIDELAYAPFFLTVHDVVAHARGRGILCQGRGSAANSAVCYCLGITEVDPTRVPILFERFVSRERREPPDIDVDFEHERREEVLQYLYAKYGRERAALAATVICYRPRSAVRDVGRALGFDPVDVERLAGNLDWWDGVAVVPARLRELGFDPAAPLSARLIALVQELVGFPRHLSQHVGGMVIARDALTRLVPVENAAMPGRTVIQWDKDDLEALGLLKVDCLALGMLSAIRRCFDLVAAQRGHRWTLATLPPEDPATYAMVQRADTVGVFQIESRAQMSMLPRLRPACYYDLVVQVAIVRPGPIQGQMVHPYLERRMGREPIDYPSAAVRGVLERTLGVPIFQEQVIALATVAAGFSPGEADQLRRSLASFRDGGGLSPLMQRLVDGMRARGYADDFIARICRQLRGFGAYGFPESHAASFALLVYASAWLKCHEPAAFLAALLNSQPMGFYAPAQLVADARRRGVEVRPVSVLASDWDSTLEPSAGAAGSPATDTAGPPDARASALPRTGQGAAAPAFAVRLGLRLLKGLGEAIGRRIETARRQAPFTDVADLAQRAKLDGTALEALTAADALAGLAGNRHQARWQVAGLRRPLPLEEATAAGRAAPSAAALVLLPSPSEAADIVADYRSQGLTLRRHPLALLRGGLRRRGYLGAAELAALGSDTIVRIAGLVTCRQRPQTASGVLFITLEDEHGPVNVIVRGALVEGQRREAVAARLLGVVGHVQSAQGVMNIVAHRLQDLSHWLGRLAPSSRDFH
ncbi:MAG TPA: error-prone DNA polymerase, partial [Gammaproteobacteria bacterium]|nr:error-prone DNA polymerase [Gammaproteobacteria bacterium]